MSDLYNPFWNGTDYNPIISVDGVALPICPSAFEWEEEDLSDANAGRSEDYKMHKNRGGPIRRLSLEWQHIPIQTAQRIMSMFHPEYVTVLFVDPDTDPNYGYRREESFYVGNRKLSMKNTRLNICSKLSFNLVSEYADTSY
ncbi:MAG: hypothetical protein IJH07_05430 [Ruminococcus sp.]|nr:hypothetical protein [Ruminococcus sp.]